MDIVLDFDGTITEQDTISTLATYAISQNGDRSKRDWDDIIAAYALDYENYIGKYRPKTADRTTISQELAFLNGLRPVELASLARVRNAALFRDISPDDFFRFGRKTVEEGRVRIRRGFPELLDLLQRTSRRAAVVSVNWSEDFIRGCCSSSSSSFPLSPQLGGGDAAEEGSFLPVFANAVDYPSGRIRNCTVPGLPRDGDDDGLILTADDKFTALEAASRALGRNTAELVYIGDSSTDLRCLLEAGQGIVIAADDGEKESSLLRTLRRLDYRVGHVDDRKRGSGLVWARDFGEIVASGILSG